MTDKVQKIKNWISKEQDGLMDAQGNFEFPEHEGAYHILSNLDTYIDSLQEEPVSSIWHNASEKSNEPENVVIINPFDNTGEVLTKCVDVYQGHIWAYTSELLKLYNLCKVGKNLQEEPVSEDLEKAAVEAFKQIVDSDKNNFLEIFKAGAKWQKEHLWKPADGDDLPIIDREVIALLDNGKVVFAHRPPEYWDGKNIVTGKVTRNYPKTYDKGGWNMPNVKYWLDAKLPHEEK